MIISIILLTLFFSSFFFYKKWKDAQRNHLNYAAQIEARISQERKDAIKASRAVIKGQVSEHLAPFLPNFPYDSSDAKFFGQPIDLVVFPGMSSGEVTEVVLIDIKTGGAALSKVQRQIKKCVEDGKVRFEVFKAS